MKYSIALIILLTSMKSFGQFSKGDKVLSGAFSLNAQRTPDILNRTTFGFSPSIGFLVSENLEVGGLIGYSFSGYKQNSIPLITEWDSHNISIGLRLQRYFKITDNFLFSIAGNIHYGREISTNKTTNTSTNDVIENETKEGIIGLRASPNFIFFPSYNWAIVASIGSFGYNYSERLSEFDISYGNIGLGVSYYFRQERK